MAAKKVARKAVKKSTNKKAVKKSTKKKATKKAKKPKKAKRVLIIGSRRQVMHGTRKKTKGGLTKDDLKYNKAGLIVSKKRSALGKKALKNLHNAGYVAKKGTFTLFKKIKK